MNRFYRKSKESRLPKLPDNNVAKAYPKKTESLEDTGYYFEWPKPGAKSVFVRFYSRPETTALVRVEELDATGKTFGKVLRIPFNRDPFGTVIYYNFLVNGKGQLLDEYNNLESVVGDEGFTFYTLNVVSQPRTLPSHDRRGQTLKGSRSDGISPEPNIYHRLDFDSHEFRILTLHSAPEEFMLEGSLTHASLIDPPSYTALSYHWGDPKHTKKMAINGVKVDITLNLYSALERIRTMISLGPKKRNNKYLLWVDALCINQDDNVEKSHQIRSMIQIYSRAKDVLCYVGENREIECQLAEIQNIIPRNEQTWTDQTWNSLNILFSLPYWRRVWIIQEISVSTSVRIVCGSVVMPWENVSAILKMMKDATPKFRGVSGRHSYQEAMHLLEFRERFTLKGERINLMDALKWSCTALATDPRDKIFSLLGLCHDTQTLVPLPNYKQPFPVIFGDMTGAMISFDRSLDIICLQGSKPSTKNPELPSWVPNWTPFMTALESQFQEWHRRYSFNPVLQGSNYQKLKVNGILFGDVSNHISSVMAPSDEPVFQTGLRLPWLSSVQSLRGEIPGLRDSSSTQFQTRDAIWRTLTMNSLVNKMSGEAARSCFSSLWRPEGRGTVQNLALIEWIDRNAQMAIDRRVLHHWSRCSTNPKNPKGHTTEELHTFIEALEKTLASGMKLVRINAAGYVATLAMVPADTQKDDLVYCLRGCSIPVVLRAIGDPTTTDPIEMRVIGGAYFHSDVREGSILSKLMKSVAEEDIEGSVCTVVGSCAPCSQTPKFASSLPQRAKQPQPQDNMANLSSGTHILSGLESQRLRTFCSSETLSANDLDDCAILLQNGILSTIRDDFENRAKQSNIEKAREALAAIQYGPTRISLFNFLLQLTILNPSSRPLYKLHDISHWRLKFLSIQRI
ncbi:hypothetical protein G7Y89_g12789 [Cudoniella acicularis]|uniref:Heterokaryon incompatibility domain-containing protein n=1 Tax=Cudoniella acicularis TaxID=354080 RepID=A0A8H4RAV1_9HELO|nr:hypothetical protein G7Y89_g12789 [Cudoniella acicularis]